ncbi:MAG: hypothetical protein Alpg2KO_11860 [Alphaproteobacteria bacterium]
MPWDILGILMRKVELINKCAPATSVHTYGRLLDAALFPQSYGVNANLKEHTDLITQVSAHMWRGYASGEYPALVRAEQIDHIVNLARHSASHQPRTL